VIPTPIPTGGSPCPSAPSSRRGGTSPGSVRRRAAEARATKPEPFDYQVLGELLKVF